MEDDRKLLELAAKAAGYTVNARMQAERDATRRAIVRAAAEIGRAME